MTFARLPLLALVCALASPAAAQTAADADKFVADAEATLAVRSVERVVACR